MFTKNTHKSLRMNLILLQKAFCFLGLMLACFFAFFGYLNDKNIQIIKESCKKKTNHIYTHTERESDRFKMNYLTLFFSFSHDLQKSENSKEKKSKNLISQCYITQTNK